MNRKDLQKEINELRRTIKRRSLNDEFDPVYVSWRISELEELLVKILEHELSQTDC